MDVIASVRSTGPCKAMGTSDAFSLPSEGGEILQNDIVTEGTQMPRKAHIRFSSRMFNQER